MAMSTSGMRHPAFIALVVLTIVALIGFVAVLFTFLWITTSRAPSTTSKASLGRSAAVVVLGDIGRSPRMCFHAQSLAEDGWRVAVVGYKGALPPPPLRRSSVKLHYVVQPFARFINALPRTGGLFAILTAPLKLLGQSVALFWILSTQVKPPPELIIVQTPPALPTLFIVRLVGMLLGSRLIIDWHNLGHSILALRFSPSSIIVRTARALERWTGKKAFAHLCVTNALRQHLIENWRVKGPVKVLYDRPPDHYRRSGAFETHSLYTNLLPTLDPPLSDWCAPNTKSSNAFTRLKEGGGTFAQSDRPAIVVSSTSWTADEDFGMLLRAASLYEQRARSLNNASSDSIEPSSPITLDSPKLDTLDLQRLPSPSNVAKSKSKNRRVSLTSEVLPKATKLPKMLLIVTGKGELRDQYVKEIARREREEDWQWVRIRTAWLAIEDYPTLLGSADVGVSLHSSSSGLDLPMKVVDMLGCGLTVCALGFPCIGELVQHGQNGLVFYSDKQLAEQLESLLADHPDPSWLASRTSSFPSLFPEDVPQSPAVSPASSPSLGYPADTPRSSSPPMSTESARPSSPLPMFSLLQSPVQAKFDLAATQHDGFPRLRNWAGNWKRVVRPLIMAADLEDDKELFRARQKVEKSKPSQRKMSGEGNVVGKDQVDARRREADAVRHRRLIFEGGEAGGEIDSGHLRLRSTVASLQAPADIPSSANRIPGIHISAPENTP